VGIDTTSLLLNYGALGVVLILLLTGVLVPGFVYRKLERENETYRDALSVERQRNADLQQFAVTGQTVSRALQPRGCRSKHTTRAAASTAP
jgi:hypothetical protein